MIAEQARRCSWGREEVLTREGNTGGVGVGGGPRAGRLDPAAPDFDRQSLFCRRLALFLGPIARRLFLEDRVIRLIDVVKIPVTGAFYQIRER